MGRKAFHRSRSGRHCGCDVLVRRPCHVRPLPPVRGQPALRLRWRQRRGRNPFDTTGVADGEYVITALVDYSGQPDVVLDASFTVENGGTSAPVLWVSTGDEQHPTTDTTAVADTTTTSAGAVTDDEDEGGGLSMLGGGGWARSWYHHGGIHIGLRTDGVLTYTFGDHLGTVATTRQWFLPYGTPRAGSADTDIGFTAQRLLPQGLIDLRARQYDPVTGRFTQPDTIIPDPANLTDPTGHIPTPATTAHATPAPAPTTPTRATPATDSGSTFPYPTSRSTPEPRLPSPSRDRRLPARPFRRLGRPRPGSQHRRR